MRIDWPQLDCCSFPTLYGQTALVSLYHDRDLVSVPALAVVATRDNVARPFLGILATSVGFSLCKGKTSNKTCSSAAFINPVGLTATVFNRSFLLERTRAAFEAKLQRSSRATDFRVPQSICTMFNVMVDAKAQSAKLCAMDLGQEVGKGTRKQILFKTVGINSRWGN